jgi:iron complex outermembrane receptor protein
LTLTSISSNRVYDDNRKSDWDFSSYYLMHNQVDSQYNKLSQELRLNSSADKLKWLVGVYFDRDDNEVHTEQDSMVPSMVTTNDRDFEGDAYAVFGQASYPLMEKLRLTAGLRYEKQEMEFTDNIAGNHYENSWDEISPKIALDYNMTPEMMAYASISKGYRSGGFNTYATDPQYAGYDEEKLWSYEVGLKTATPDQRLIVNGALYYMDIQDMQVNEAVTPMVAYLTNAAEASAIGGEIDITARLSEGLTLLAGFGYTNIEFDDFQDAAGDYEGNKTPYAPDYTFNVGTQYRSAMGFYIRGDLIGCGRLYYDKENEYSRDPYQIVNAKIGYETAYVDLYLYGKNIFDEEYDDNGIFDGLYTVYSDPREIGAKLTYRF